MMATTYCGRTYRSKKHPVLEYIFDKYHIPNTNSDIHFSLYDISEGYRACENTDPSSGIKEPSSISNTILDLTRQNRGISSRLPSSISSLGYDVCKRTGKNSHDNSSYAGTFVFVGVGNEYNTWLTWPSMPRTLIVDPNRIPNLVQIYLRNDEGALFSVLDYCNILSDAFPQFGNIIRVQNPMKWQPNEIDGFYISVIGNVKHVFPIEAKALSTKDDINLIQFAGGVKTVMEKLSFDDYTIINPIAAQMVSNGLLLGLFEPVSNFAEDYVPILIDTVLISFSPILNAWK